MRRESLTLTVGHESLRGFLVSVETSVRGGLFHFDIVGLATKTVSESKQRILSAVQNCESTIKSPVRKKIVTLLSPAGEKKEGAHFDLPIAVSYIMATDSDMSSELLDFLSEVVFIGELALSGSLRPTKNIPLLVEVATQKGAKYIVVPFENLREVSALQNIKIWPVKHLSEISIAFKAATPEDVKRRFEACIAPDKVQGGDKKSTFLIDSVEGNNIAKRALLIALAGKHHIVFVGEPGTGKSLLAKSSRELVPEAASEEVCGLPRISSKHGDYRGLDKNNFREPHHTSSYSDIVGGKKHVGEIALADQGILFLDELTEFDRRTLESLRQPLENGCIQHKELGLIPADFILIGCMNPCGCGYRGSRGKKCICAKSQIDRHERKMHSPLFERIDLKINVNENHDLAHGQKTDGKFIKEAIFKVRLVQNLRYGKLSAAIGLPENHPSISKELKIAACAEIRRQIEQNSETSRIFSEAVTSRRFSRRIQDSILLVARTIADLDQSKEIAPEHILEAISYKKI